MTGTTHIPAEMMAPCGMNCGICSGFLRAKNRCVGCNYREPIQIGGCRKCMIKFCEHRPEGAGFCVACSRYPCRRLKDLDKRYRTKYGMSMLENLAAIQEMGLDRFMEVENTRWVCPECGAPICVHDRKCYTKGCRGTLARTPLDAGTS